MILSSFLSTRFGQAIALIAACTVSPYLIYRFIQSRNTIKPLSVNFHFTRKCNKTCVFCFHTEKTSHVASEEDMKRGLRAVHEAP